MKEPRDWDEAYILNNLPQWESDQIEFKGRRVVDLTIPEVNDIDRTSLAKTLSAFANSGGGALILGINKTRQVDDGGINVAIKPNGTKEWLEDILPHLVDSPLTKLNVYSIIGKSPESTILPDRALYVVEIGDSALAPHQSIIDHIYYGRVGGRSLPLGHRMVMDIINRRLFPYLKIEFHFGFVDEADPNLVKREGEHPVLMIEIKNQGPVYAQYVNSILFIPKYLVEPLAIRSILGGRIVELEDSVKYVRIARENVVQETREQGEIVSRGPGRYTPILPGRTHSWVIPLVNKFTIHQMNFRDTPKIYWELYADNAPCNKGNLSMSKIQLVPNISE
jgi:hypothetical protein